MKTKLYKRCITNDLFYVCICVLLLLMCVSVQVKYLWIMNRINKRPWK